MRKTLFVLLLSCFISQLHAKDFSVSGYLEASTAYMFRGSKGCGANVSPCLALKWKDLMLQTYGYVSFDGTYKEVDLELSYSIGPVSFRFGDYYFHMSGIAQPDNYFCYAKNATNHMQEAIIYYEPQKLPFALRWFTFIFGDWIPDADSARGKPSFSSYLEAELYHEFTPNSRLSLVGGASVLKGMYTSYTKDFAVIVAELRYRYAIPAGPVKIPLQVSYMVNPYAKTSWLNASVGISF